MVNTLMTACGKEIRDLSVAPAGRIVVESNVEVCVTGWLNVSLTVWGDGAHVDISWELLCKSQMTNSDIL